jgi:hypothetical protein
MSTAQRKVVIHYHLFKNAGTSVDRMLKEIYGERWVTHLGGNNTPRLEE